MAYDYSSESKVLELPNPYTLQNRLLWLCAVVLLAGGVTSLVWARDAMQGQSFQLVVAPLFAGLVMVAAGLACATAAARRLRFFFGRGRPASLAPEIAQGTVGGSAAAERIKDILRQGGLTYPEPQGAIEGVLYHWAPRLITSPNQVQALASRYVFNLAAFTATLVSFLFSWLLFGNEATRPWIGIIYFFFGLFFLLRPMLSHSVVRMSTASLVGLIAAAILGPVFIGLLGPSLPALGSFSLNTQTFVMLLTALGACALAMVAVLAQVDNAPHTRASMEQSRLSMNAPPATLLDELDRTLQSEWTERIPNRRYARLEPVTSAATPSGAFSGELFEETQPLPVSGTQAPTFSGALSDRRHRAVLLLDLYATAMVLVALGLALYFVRNFDALAAFRDNRFSLVGTSAILAFVAAFCFKSAAGLWGRFNFQSELIWVEMMGNYQTSRIGTGNNFTSRMNTENTVVRTENMTLRVWRARIESVVFGKDAHRQVTAMFSTEKEAKALSTHLMQFAQSQSVLVAAMSNEDQARMAMINAGERNLQSATEASSAVQLQNELRATAALASAQAADVPAGSALASAGTGAQVYCTQCGTLAPPLSKFCAKCGAALPA